MGTAKLTLDIKAAAGGAASAAAGPGAFAFGGVLGGLGAGFGPGGGLGGVHQPALFSLTYSLRHRGTGKVLLADNTAQEEYGGLRKSYYHKTRWSAKPAKDTKEEDSKDNETFPLFVHDEILLLQTG